MYSTWIGPSARPIVPSQAEFTPGPALTWPLGNNGGHSFVQGPVHVCWGDADAVSPAPVARYLKEKVCPAATLTLMPGVGHFCQLSDPEPWLASVLGFYRERCGLR